MKQLKLVRRCQHFGDNEVVTHPDTVLVEAPTFNQMINTFHEWCEKHGAAIYEVDANSGELSVQGKNALLSVQYTDLETGETLISIAEEALIQYGEVA